MRYKAGCADWRDVAEGAELERGRVFSLILLASLVSATPILAAPSDICADLHGQLANIPETIGTGRQSKRMTAAIGEQNEAIRAIEDEWRNRGCSNSALVAPEDAAVCDQLQSSADRLQEDLRYLLARQAETQGSGEDGAARAQLEAALRENGCDEPLSGETEIIGGPEEPPPTPEQQAMRADTFYPPMGEDQPIAPPLSPYAGGAGLQTVCVRTCDGGFFPLTTNATPLNFQQDASTCARMCPDVSTELYYRYLPGQESSDMVSAATGQRYSAMPYAFAYRKRKPGEKSACTCNLPAYYEEMQRDRAISAPDTGSSGSSIITIETAKPKPSQAATTPDNPPEERPYDSSTNKVRKVGPQFLGSDQGAIDLKHPAAPGPQPQQ